MHERFARRIEERLVRLGQRVQRARRALEVRRLERQVGRLLERNQRAAGRYLIEFVPIRRCRRACDLSGAPAGVGRLGALERRLLHPAHQRDRLESRRSVAYVYSAHRRRGRASHPEERAGDSSGVAPNARTASRPISSSASSRTCCGRRSNRGSTTRGSARVPARSAMSFGGFRVRTSCCRPRTGANFACAAGRRAGRPP